MYCSLHQPVVGVVYNFVTDELYAAQKGKGATVNEKPLRVSPCTGAVPHVVCVCGMGQLEHVCAGWVGCCVCVWGGWVVACVCGVGGLLRVCVGWVGCCMCVWGGWVVACVWGGWVVACVCGVGGLLRVCGGWVGWSMCVGWVGWCICMGGWVGAYVWDGCVGVEYITFLAIPVGSLCFRAKQSCCYIRDGQ